MTLGVKLRLSDQCSLADAYTSYTITIAITITLFKVTVYCIRSLFYCYDQKKNLVRFKLKEGGYFGSHFKEVQSIMVGKALQQEYETVVSLCV